MGQSAYERLQEVVNELSSVDLDKIRTLMVDESRDEDIDEVHKVFIIRYREFKN